MIRLWSKLMRRVVDPPRLPGAGRVGRHRSTSRVEGQGATTEAKALTPGRSRTVPVEQGRQSPPSTAATPVSSAPGHADRQRRKQPGSSAAVPRAAGGRADGATAVAVAIARNGLGNLVTGLVTSFFRDGAAAPASGSEHGPSAGNPAASNVPPTSDVFLFSLAAAPAPPGEAKRLAKGETHFRLSSVVLSGSPTPAAGEPPGTGAAEELGVGCFLVSGVAKVLASICTAHHAAKHQELLLMRQLPSEGLKDFRQRRREALKRCHMLLLIATDQSVTQGAELERDLQHRLSVALRAAPPPTSSAAEYPLSATVLVLPNFVTVEQVRNILMLSKELNMDDIKLLRGVPSVVSEVSPVRGDEQHALGIGEATKTEDASATARRPLTKRDHSDTGKTVTRASSDGGPPRVASDPGKIQHSGEQQRQGREPKTAPSAPVAKKMRSAHGPDASQRGTTTETAIYVTPHLPREENEALVFMSKQPMATHRLFLTLADNNTQSLVMSAAVLVPANGKELDSSRNSPPLAASGDPALSTAVGFNLLHAHMMPPIAHVICYRLRSFSSLSGAARQVQWYIHQLQQQPCQGLEGQIDAPDAVEGRAPMGNRSYTPIVVVVCPPDTAQATATDEETRQREHRIILDLFQSLHQVSFDRGFAGGVVSPEGSHQSPMPICSNILILPHGVSEEQLIQACTGASAPRSSSSAAHTSVTSAPEGASEHPLFMYREQLAARLIKLHCERELPREPLSKQRPDGKPLTGCVREKLVLANPSPEQQLRALAVVRAACDVAAIAPMPPIADTEPAPATRQSQPVAEKERVTTETRGTTQAPHCPEPEVRAPPAVREESDARATPVPKAARSASSPPATVSVSTSPAEWTEGRAQQMMRSAIDEVSVRYELSFKHLIDRLEDLLQINRTDAPQGHSKQGPAVDKKESSSGATSRGPGTNILLYLENFEKQLEMIVGVQHAALKSEVVAEVANRILHLQERIQDIVQQSNKEILSRLEAHSVDATIAAKSNTAASNTDGITPSLLGGILETINGERLLLANVAKQIQLLEVQLQQLGQQQQVQAQELIADSKKSMTAIQDTAQRMLDITAEGQADAAKETGNAAARLEQLTAQVASLGALVQSLLSAQQQFLVASEMARNNTQSGEESSVTPDIDADSHHRATGAALSDVRPSVSEYLSRFSAAVAASLGPLQANVAQATVQLTQNEAKLTALKATADATEHQMADARRDIANLKSILQHVLEQLSGQSASQAHHLESALLPVRDRVDAIHNLLETNHVPPQQLQLAYSVELQAAIKEIKEHSASVAQQQYQTLSNRLDEICSELRRSVSSGAEPAAAPPSPPPVVPREIVALVEAMSAHVSEQKEQLEQHLRELRTNQELGARNAEAVADHWKREAAATMEKLLLAGKTVAATATSVPVAPVGSTVAGHLGEGDQMLPQYFFSDLTRLQGLIQHTTENVIPRIVTEEITRAIQVAPFQQVLARVEQEVLAVRSSLTEQRTLLTSNTSNSDLASSYARTSDSLFPGDLSIKLDAVAERSKDVASSVADLSQEVREVLKVVASRSCGELTATQSDIREAAQQLESHVSRGVEAVMSSVSGSCGRGMIAELTELNARLEERLQAALNSAVKGFTHSTVSESVAGGAPVASGAQDQAAAAVLRQVADDISSSTATAVSAAAQHLQAEFTNQHEAQGERIKQLEQGIAQLLAKSQAETSANIPGDTADRLADKITSRILHSVEHRFTQLQADLEARLPLNGATGRTTTP